MRIIIALARKDLRVLSRVRSGMFFTFVWPLVVAILFGVVFAGQGNPTTRAVRIALVDGDRSDASRAFAQTLQASGDFAIEDVARAEAEALVRRGRLAAYVVIRPGFGAASQSMFYGPSRQLEIASDPARGAEQAMIEGLLTKHALSDLQSLFSNPGRSKQMVEHALAGLGPAANASPNAPLGQFLGALGRYLDAPAAAAGTGNWQPLAITRTPLRRDRIGPDNSFEITFPQGIMWGIIGCVMSFAIGLVGERVRGTFVRLQTAPLSQVQILGGKALACFVAISALQAVLVGVGVLAFDVRPSSYALLALACLCASLGFVGFMMMIAGLGRTEQATGGAGWAMLMPMTLLGGGMMPRFIMPSWMQTLGNVSPVKWAILGFEGAVWRGFTLGEMVLPCTILLLFGAVCFAIGVRGMRAEG